MPSDVTPKMALMTMGTRVEHYVNALCWLTTSVAVLVEGSPSAFVVSRRAGLTPLQCGRCTDEGDYTRAVCARYHASVHRPGFGARGLIRRISLGATERGA
jgi:hypothetical protein